MLDKTKFFVDDIKRSLVSLEYHNPNSHQEQQSNEQAKDGKSGADGVEYGNFPSPRIAKQLSNKQRMLETYLALDLDATLRFYAEVTTCGLDTLQQYKDEIKNRGREQDFSGLRYEDSEQGFLKLDVQLVVLGAHRDSSSGMLAPALMNWRIKHQEPIRVGLMIGPFYLDWNEHHLVIPRKLFSSAAASLNNPPASVPSKLPPFSIHIGTCQVWEVAEKVADIIIDFNCNRVYSDQLNSQTFVYAVLEKLGLHKKLEGALHSFTNENVVAALKQFGDAMTSHPDGINWETLTVPDTIQNSFRDLILHISGGPGAEGPIICGNDELGNPKHISGAFTATSITADSLISIVEDGATDGASPSIGDEHNKAKKRSSFRDLLSGGLFGRKRASAELSSSSKHKQTSSSGIFSAKSSSDPNSRSAPSSGNEQAQPTLPQTDQKQGVENGEPVVTM